MEQLGNYKFNVYEDFFNRAWIYVIYDNMANIIAKSDELFDEEGIARYAAIGHISKLEQESSSCQPAHS